MTCDELYAHYGSWCKLAKQLGFANNTPMGWKKKGYIPLKTQVLIEKRSNGLFKANWNDCPEFKA